MRVKHDFMGVNARVWWLFHHIHGVTNAKPGDESAVCRVELNLYSPGAEPESDLVPDELANLPANEQAQRWGWQFVDM